MFEWLQLLGLLYSLSLIDHRCKSLSLASYFQQEAETLYYNPTSLQYHKNILEFDGQGGYTFTRIGDANKRLALQEEKQVLEQKLAGLPRMREKLEELRGVKRAGGG